MAARIRPGLWSRIDAGRLSCRPQSRRCALRDPSRIPARCSPGLSSRARDRRPAAGQAAAAAPHSQAPLSESRPPAVPRLPCARLCRRPPAPPRTSRTAGVRLRLPAPHLILVAEGFMLLSLLCRLLPSEPRRPGRHAGPGWQLGPLLLRPGGRTPLAFGLVLLGDVVELTC